MVSNGLRVRILPFPLNEKMYAVIEFDSFICLDSVKSASRWTVKTLSDICGSPIKKEDHAPLNEKSYKPTFVLIRNPFDLCVSTFAYANGHGPCGVRRSWHHQYLWKTGKGSKITWDSSNSVEVQEFKWFLEESTEMFPFGFQTARFLKLVLGLPNVYGSVLNEDTDKLLWMKQIEDLFKEKSLAEILKLEEQKRHYTHVVSVENLEEDLVDFFEDVQPNFLVDDWRQQLKQRILIKDNSSKRKPDYTDYYDDECVKLVSASERFLMERFGYTFGSATEIGES